MDAVLGRLRRDRPGGPRGTRVLLACLGVAALIAIGLIAGRGAGHDDEADVAAPDGGAATSAAAAASSAPATEAAVSEAAPASTAAAEGHLRRGGEAAAAKGGASPQRLRPASGRAPTRWPRARPQARRDHGPGGTGGPRPHHRQHRTDGGERRRLRRGHAGRPDRPDRQGPRRGDGARPANPLRHDGRALRGARQRRRPGVDERRPDAGLRGHGEPAAPCATGGGPPGGAARPRPRR